MRGPSRASLQPCLTDDIRGWTLAENFLPKVDGVTRTLARLLEHLESEGHEAILCGPETGMVRSPLSHTEANRC